MVALSYYQNFLKRQPRSSSRDVFRVVEAKFATMSAKDARSGKKRRQCRAPYINAVKKLALRDCYNGYIDQVVEALDAVAPEAEMRRLLYTSPTTSLVARLSEDTMHCVLAYYM
jgi:hypothetical protein